jgi:transketolase
MNIPSYEEVLGALAQSNPDLVVLTAENRAAIRHLPEQLGPRFIDVGICEQTMIGAAAGLALRGRLPVVHALATFLTLRAFEFIRTDVGIAGLRVKLVGGVPGFLSEANGPTHQAIEDVALMRGIPGMQVFCPSDEVELAQGMPAAIAVAGPVYVRFNAVPARVPHSAGFEWGKAEVHGQGSDVAILSYGLLVGEAAAALELLAKRGIEGRLLNMRTLAPFDREEVLRAAQECDLIVTLEDHLRLGGLHTIVTTCLAEEAVTARFLGIGLDRWFRPAMLPDVLCHEGFTAPQLAERIEHTLTRQEFSRCHTIVIGGQ